MWKGKGSDQGAEGRPWARAASGAAKARAEAAGGRRARGRGAWLGTRGAWVGARAHVPCRWDPGPRDAPQGKRSLASAPCAVRLHPSRRITIKAKTTTKSRRGSVSMRCSL